jgi:hypothetical protein
VAHSLGILTYKSRFLGVWLAVNGFTYLALSATGFLLPQYENTVGNITFPILFGEVAFMLWLLVMGAKPQSRHRLIGERLGSNSYLCRMSAGARVRSSGNTCSCHFTGTDAGI